MRYACSSGAFKGVRLSINKHGRLQRFPVLQLHRTEQASSSGCNQRAVIVWIELKVAGYQIPPYVVK